MSNTPNEFTDRSYVDAHMDDALRNVGDASFSRKLRALWRMLDEATVWEVTIILAALGYFLWPVDLVPDVIPVVGWSDDMVVVSAAIAQLGNRIARYLN